MGIFSWMKKRRAKAKSNHSINKAADGAKTMLMIEIADLKRKLKHASNDEERKEISEEIQQKELSMGMIVVDDLYQEAKEREKAADRAAARLGGVRYDGINYGEEEKREVTQKTERKELLGSGIEGDVFATDVTLEKDRKGGAGKISHKLNLVEKQFKTELRQEDKPFRNPIFQVKMAQELISLNRNKRLGLRLPATVRLIEEPGKDPTLLMTKFDKVLKITELNSVNGSEFVADRDRQIAILGREGYYAVPDCFIPALDKKSGKVQAILADFGNLYYK
jgi:hypothetical protein